MILPTESSVAARSRRRFGAPRATLVLALAIAAGGCGQKGPLTLPKAAAPAASAPAR